MTGGLRGCKSHPTNNRVCRFYIAPPSPRMHNGERGPSQPPDISLSGHIGTAHRAPLVLIVPFLALRGGLQKKTSYVSRKYGIDFRAGGLQITDTPPHPERLPPPDNPLVGLYWGFRPDLLCASLRVPCRIFGGRCGPVVGSEPPLLSQLFLVVS